MATALIASTLLTGGLPFAGFASLAAAPPAGTGFAPAGFAPGLTGMTLAAAAFAALFGFSGAFFATGCFAFDFAAAFAAAALFHAITVLCAARSGLADSEKGQRKRHPNESRPEVWVGLIKPRLTLDQPAKPGLFGSPSASRVRGGITPY